MINPPPSVGPFRALLYITLIVYMFSMLAYTVLHPRHKFWGSILAGAIGAYVGIWALLGN